jgi:hypothetical protein
MTPVEFLQDKFAATEHRFVSDWMKDTKIDLSLQSCTTVILRGVEKGLIVMLTLASALGCTPEEMQWIAKELGDRTIWRLITPQQLTNDESQLLSDYHSLSADQRKIIKDMIKEMTK